MREVLNNCRRADSAKNRKREWICTALIIALGAVLGVASKLIDNMALNDMIAWHRLFGIIDLGNVLSDLAVWALLALAIAVYSARPLRASANVFGFFAGMLTGYYVTTVTVSGFFPRTYMTAWAIITLATPVLAFFAWYAKGKGWLAAFLSAVIIAFFITQAFAFGMVYVNISDIPEVIFFVATVAILFRSVQQTFVSLI